MIVHYDRTLHLYNGRYRQALYDHLHMRVLVYYLHYDITRYEYVRKNIPNPHYALRIIILPVTTSINP